MIDNPFDIILNFYNKQVKEEDKKEYANVFKSCSEVFFHSINEYLIETESPVHFEDIEYRDGYFIFGFGTNSVVHFRVKECPGWLFGIWWDLPDEDSKTQNQITGKFFAQYEEIIDKFKPSCSAICEDIIIHIDKPYCDCWKVNNQIRFIIKEPYLAFCRDYCMFDYNTKYLTREEAKSMYEDYKNKKKKREEITGLCNKKILDFVKENIIPLFKDSEIIDDGKNNYPRYRLIAPLKSNIDEFSEEGIYNWFDENDEEGQILIKEYNRIKQECEKIADENKLIYFEAIYPEICLYDYRCYEYDT